MKTVGKIACFLLLCMVVVAPHAKAAITCSQVQAGLVRCLPYLTNRGPLGGCCGAFQAIWGAAKTPQDRRTACSCTKAANIIKGIDYGKATALPGVCHVNVPSKISLSVDCNNCLPYLTNRGPLGSCCSVTKGLVTAAKTPQDRRTACACVISAFHTIKGIDFGKAAGLSDVCHASLQAQPLH